MSEEDLAMMRDQAAAWMKRCVRAENALRGIMEETEKRQLPITCRVNDMAREGLGERAANA